MAASISKNEAPSGLTAYWVILGNDHHKIRLGAQSILNPTNINVKELQVQKVRKNIEPAAGNKAAQIHKGFSVTTVHFTVHERLGENPQKNSPYMRVTAKIEDLANFLQVGVEDIKKAVKEQSLDALIANSLAGAVEKQRTPRAAKVVPPNWKTGLSGDDYDCIKRFYKYNVKDLSLLKEPIHISKHEKGYAGQQDLPYSLIFVPKGPQKGLLVLLKTHTELEELGVGGVNRATWALHMDSGEPRADRSAKRKHVPENEKEANRELSNDPRHFVTGQLVDYEGKYRKRGGRAANEPKDHIPQKEHVKKTAFICPIMVVNLYDILTDGEPPSPTDPDTLQIGLAYVKLIQILASRGFVHFDQKPSNVFIGSDGKLRLGDFGATVKVGSKRSYYGTPCYVAPELFRERHTGGSIKADPSADIWSMGCVLADICGSPLVNKYLRKHHLKDDLIKCFESGDFEDAKEQYLPERHNPKHIHYIIDKCLSVDPKDRSTIEEAAASLKAITPHGGAY
jgi:Protein kinase domain